MFIDSHAHLEMPQFDADRDAMLARAYQAGVETVVAIGSGTGPGSLDCAIQLANRERAGEPRIYATVGIHPHEAKLATDVDFEELRGLAANPRVIAWGEIGLDYFYDHSPREVQRSVFLKQLELACAARLPVVIHCRPSADSQNAWDECLEILTEQWAPTGLRGVLHCFTGSMQYARRARELPAQVLRRPASPAVRPQHACRQAWGAWRGSLCAAVPFAASFQWRIYRRAGTLPQSYPASCPGVAAPT